MTNKSRAEFESFEISSFGFEPDEFTSGNTGDYIHMTIRSDWAVWQASRKVALEDAAEVCLHVSTGYLPRYGVAISATKHCADVIRKLI
jgi:hypothetical protein